MYSPASSLGSSTPTGGLMGTLYPASDRRSLDLHPGAASTQPAVSARCGGRRRPALCAPRPPTAAPRLRATSGSLLMTSLPSGMRCSSTVSNEPLCRRSLVDHVAAARDAHLLVLVVLVGLHAVAHNGQAAGTQHARGGSALLVTDWDGSAPDAA